MDLKNIKIAVIGLGYVGLPLAVEFGKKIKTIGFDIHAVRIQELRAGKDKTLEVTAEELKRATYLSYTTILEDIIGCNIYIVTVPTPIDQQKQPDLTLLKTATASVGKVLNIEDLVIYESTVYPGVTEEVCAPILEEQSGLRFNKDFYCGYSPERINPGDKEYSITKITKVTSGSTPATATRVDDLYKEIIVAGTHKACSIKVAEAAKIIENTQRDVNIALINELAIIFRKLGIDTEDVLKAASTKWNFFSFHPGLVGGHCIGVDPYYIAYKANELGYYPKMILTGRHLNDKMGSYVVGQVLELMENKRICIAGANILIMGVTFKENCPDIRNTKVVDIFEGFKNLNCNVEVYDPLVDKDEVQDQCDITMVDVLKEGYYNAIIISVAHDEFKKMSAESFRKLGRANHVLYDIKSILRVDEVDGRL